MQARAAAGRPPASGPPDTFLAFDRNVQNAFYFLGRSGPERKPRKRTERTPDPTKNERKEGPHFAWTSKQIRLISGPCSPRRHLFLHLELRDRLLVSETPPARLSKARLVGTGQCGGVVAIEWRDDGIAGNLSGPVPVPSVRVSVGATYGPPVQRGPPSPRHQPGRCARGDNPQPPRQPVDVRGQTRDPGTPPVG